MVTDRSNRPDCGRAHLLQISHTQGDDHEHDQSGLRDPRRRAPQTGLAGLFQQCVALLFRRMDRQRQRRMLFELETHTLGDIGVSRRQAIEEGSKPFWR